MFFVSASVRSALEEYTIAAAAVTKGAAMDGPVMYAYFPPADVLMISVPGAPISTDEAP